MSMHGINTCSLFPALGLLLAMLAGCASNGGKPVVASEANALSAAEQPELPALPADAQAQYDQALAALKAGQVEAAKQQLSLLAAAHPNFAGSSLNLGLIELKAERYAAAAELFRRALQVDAKSAVASNYLGVSYRYLGKFKDAEAAYQAAIATDEGYAPAHLNLGVLYDLYLQRPELALAEYERYQQLLAAPDAKVSGWIKELNARLKSDRKTMASGAQP